MKRFITTPIFYPNSKPHIGHAYTCTIADFLTRYYQAQGEEVFFSTGLDEHGQKIAKTAEKNGITPQAHVDNMAEIFQDMMNQYQIAYTAFIRTTSSKHTKAVQYFWQILQSNDFIYLNKYAGWYDVSDENFVKEDEINKKTISNKQAETLAGKKVIWLEEECYFFKLSAFTEKLLEHYKNNEKAIYPKTRLRETTGFLKQSLKDIAISRTTISWGIPVPTSAPQNAIQQCLAYLTSLFRKDKHVIYVWIDALVNYLTVLGYPVIDKNFEEYWQNSTHIIGKDILKFHAVYWPGFLSAAKLPLPTTILSHGWWLIDEDKMSKSTGNIVDPIQLLEKYTSSEIRWFFMREMVFGEDANFNFHQLNMRCNELSNNIGNLIQRSLTLLQKQHQGHIIKQEDVLDYKKFVKSSQKAVESHKLHQYAQTIFDFAQASNKYFDAAQPWKDKGNSQQILSNTAYIIKILAVLFKPIMPDISSQILQALGTQADFDPITPGTTIKSLPILFPKKNS